MPLLLSSHWSELSHMATDSYMEVWEIVLLEGLKLKIGGPVIIENKEKALVDNKQSLP